MRSCSTCRDFLCLSLTTRWNRNERRDVTEYTTQRVCSVYERRIIRESAQDCQLCQTIHALLEFIYGSEVDVRDEVGESQTFVKAVMNTSILCDEKNLISSISLDRSPHIFVTRSSQPMLEFAAWADKGTPASAEFVDWPPILHGSFEESVEFVRKSLHNCQNHHVACELPHPEWEFSLPSRVLSIAEDAAGISVKLVETQGLGGRYCALSHCWGPKDKLPLQTTNKSLADHLDAIPWDKLPPLFCDAIKLTWSLGIKYLWVDSLCIVQDDLQDWHSESKKMALVYRRATLVIAAVDSEDSTQQLSKAQRPVPLTLRIPYYTQEGSIQGSFNVAPCTGLNKIISGPLRERGWVFQELYLGRRKIFFTSSGLSWACDECEMSERGNYAELELHETSSWLDCLANYSTMHLTYPTDRIIALLGIVAEMGKSRNGKFVSELGVWEDQLAEQLLWRPLQRTYEDLSDLPSWCWAATGGAKLWLTSQEPHEVTLNGTVQAVGLTDSGSLDASGLLIGAATSPLPLGECCIEHFGRVDTEFFCSGSNFNRLEGFCMPDWAGDLDDNKIQFPIVDPDGKRNILGLAIFDFGVYFSECFCFILASSHKDSTDICFLESDPSSFSNTDNDVVEDGEDACSGDVHRDTEDCVDIIEVGRSREVYWALLLQPVDETMNAFERVGMALLWPRALEKGRGEFKEFKIV